MNNTTSTITSDEATVVTRLIGAFTYAAFSLFALCSNVLLLIVLVKASKSLSTEFDIDWIGFQGRGQFRHSSFFIIAWQMLICDFISLFVQITLVTPETFAGVKVLEEKA
jgi:hypothetical protein